MNYRNKVLKPLSVFSAIIACFGTVSCNNIKDISDDVATFALADTACYYSTTFGKGSVIDVKIDISDDDWQSILDNPTLEEYHSADITVNGTSVSNAGFRTKGFSSLSSVAASDSNRYGFKVKTDKYDSSQTLNGLNEFVLNSSFNDPSYLREYITYCAMAQLDGITPFVTYANLYINNELFGFYLLIESYDDSFVRRVGTGEDIKLYKAKEESCTLKKNDDLSGFDCQYGNDKNNDAIANLRDTLNKDGVTESEIQSVLDVDSVLRAIAVNTVLGNYDSYSGSKAHNYYLLYQDGIFSYIGWDYNMSIGGFSEDNGASVNVDVSTPFYNVSAEDRPLFSKLLEKESYYAKYIEYVNKLVEYFDGYDDTVALLAKTLRSYVEADPTAFYTLEEFESNVSAKNEDLSAVSGGAMPGIGNMTPPESPDGMGKNDFDKDGVKPPDLPDGTEKNDFGKDGATPPELPDGMGQNDPGKDGATPPELPDGIGQNDPGKDGATPPELPDDMGQNKQSGDGGGMPMMNGKNVPSIIDYIDQRIQSIKAQLAK